MNKSIFKLMLTWMLTTTMLMAYSGNQLFFELSPNDLKGISESTQQVFEHDSENPVWFGLVFEGQLTSTRRDSLTLELPGMVGLFLERETLQKNDQGFLIWSGKSYGGEGQAGNAQFKLTDEGIEGFVTTAEGVLAITPIGNNIHRITLENMTPPTRPTEPVEGIQEKATRYHLAAPVLTMFSDYCYDFIWGGWTAVPGATWYELRTSEGWVLYSGPLTDNIAVNFGCCSNTDVSVKACNSYGCSNPSNWFYAVYFHYCW